MSVKNAKDIIAKYARYASEGNINVYTWSRLSSFAVAVYPDWSPLYGGLSGHVNKCPLKIFARRPAYLARFFAPTIAALPTAYAPRSVLQLPL